MADRHQLTIFAGPNGSGKSTLKRKITESGYQLGAYINADEIAATLRKSARHSGLTIDQEDLERQAFHEAETRRQDALISGGDFAFETVFSHPSKLEFIKSAKACSFFVRLFFISTENALLNVARVQSRVKEGGHSVPLGKIVSRYKRTMSLLAPASLLSDEVFLFDNSGIEMRMVASLRTGFGRKPMIPFGERIPAWVVQWAIEVSKK